MPVPSPALPAGSRTLLALGEHLDGIARLIRTEVAAEGGELEQLSAALSRCGAALDEERWRAGRGGAPPAGACAALACDGGGEVAQEPRPERHKGLGHGATTTTPASAAYFSIEHDDVPPMYPSEGEPMSPSEGEKRRDASKNSKPATERHVSTGTHTHQLDFFELGINRSWKRRPSSNKILRKIEDTISSQWTESIAAGLILLNVMFMVLDEQFKGARIGYDLGIYSHYGSDAFQEETGVPSERFFYVADVVFAVLFTIELALRLGFLRSEFVCDPWGWLDISVVVVTDVILIASYTPINVGMARAVRLARLLRIVRLVRHISLFDSLYLMTTALKGSVSVLFWVVVFLFVVQTLFALLVTNIVQDYYMGSDGEDFFETDAQKEEVYKYFGTYWRTMVSLFELMLANWPPICRLMMETMHESWSLFVLLYKLVMGFAVIGVMNGVFTQETFRAAETDDILLLKRKVTQERLHTSKMTSLFQAMASKENADMDAGINVRQFQRVLKHPEFQRWLKAMDYDTSDAELLFYLIDTNGDGTLTLDELTHGMAMLKGTARNIDIKLLMRQSIIARMQDATPKDDSGKRPSLTDTLKRMETESRLEYLEKADAALSSRDASRKPTPTAVAE